MQRTTNVINQKGEHVYALGGRGRSMRPCLMCISIRIFLIILLSCGCRTREFSAWLASYLACSSKGLLHFCVGYKWGREIILALCPQFCVYRSPLCYQNFEWGHSVWHHSLEKLPIIVLYGCCWGRGRCWGSELESLALTVGLRGPKKGGLMVQPRTQRMGERVDKGVGLASSQARAFSLSVIHC